MEIPLLPDFVIIFGLSIGVLFACHLVRIPPIVGFLITGVLAGPSGLGLVKAVHEVEIMAEIGVVLLLFTIGLELSLGELARLKKPVLLGGAMQVVLTILFFYFAASFLGLPDNKAIFIGFLASLSSTAIVLLALRQRGELESPQGRVSLSILIFQDLIIVPMMLLVPVLAGGAVSPGASLLFAVAESLGLILVVFLMARKIAPWILRQVAKTRNRELFLITTLALCLSIALLTSSMGLSLSLGAFMAGLIISDSEFSLSAMEGVLPFRDVFTSIFFISVGMLMDAGYFLSHLPLVCGAAVAVLAIKTLLAGGAALVLGYPLRPAIIVGLSLSQVGEFSFILAKSGLGAGLLGAETYQLFLAVSIMTMAGTPFLIALAPGAAERLVRLPGLSALARRRKDAGEASGGGAHDKLHDHLVIVGFGIGGKHLASAARTAGIAYSILEMNPDTVKSASRDGEPIAYGDAAQEAVLAHAGIAEARVLAVVIPDPIAVRRITETAKRLNPAVHIIARTRFMAEVGPLMELGADDVIPEDFETSIEIFTRALARYLVPREDIERFVTDIRGEGYAMLREPDVRSEPGRILGGQFSGMDVSALRLEPGCALDGQSLKEAALRQNEALTVVAVKRDGQAIPNPDGSFRLQADDVAYVFGQHARISAAANLFRAPADANGES